MISGRQDSIQVLFFFNRMKISYVTQCIQKVLEYLVAFTVLRNLDYVAVCILHKCNSCNGCYFAIKVCHCNNLRRLPPMGTSLV